MKNLKLLLMLVLPALFVFTGCEEDDPDQSLSPTIEFTGGTFVDEDVTLEPGASFSVKIRASRNTNSNSKLTGFLAERKIINTAEILDSTFNENDFVVELNLTAAATEEDETFTFTITDKDGETASLSFIVTTEGATTALGSAQNFTWERCGSTAGTGLDMFGLKWTSNTASSAIIMEDADKLVVLSSSDWASITTQEALKAAVDNGTGVTQYDGVSVTADDTYDDVLATQNGTNYYLINVTAADVTAGQACGTNVEITGEYKE